MTRAKPTRNAVEVESVVAHAPCDRAFYDLQRVWAVSVCSCGEGGDRRRWSADLGRTFICSRLLVRLALNACKRVKVSDKISFERESLF